MNRSPFTRVARRLTLLYAALFGLTLAGFVGFASDLMTRTLTAEVDRANHDAIADLTRGLGLSASGPRPLPAFRAELFEAVQLHGVATVQVFDMAGHSVDGVVPPTGRLSPVGPKRETVVTARQRLRILRVTLNDGGRPVGSMLVGHDLAATDAASHSFLLGLVEAVPIALLLTLGSGALLAAFAVRPVREALERQRRFLADASHELRTPLAVLMAQAGVVHDHPAPDREELADTLRAVYRTTERMSRLVGDLLFLSRTDSTEVVLQRQRFFLDELVEDVVEDFGDLARTRGVTIEVEHPLPEAPVDADPDRIRQALAALVDNAIKFTPASGHVTVRVALDPGRRTTLALVHDTGPGIPAEAQPRIFERFYQVDSSRSAAMGGSGLGLAIARAIALAHGGMLTLIRSTGQGATFELALPTPAPR